MAKKKPLRSVSAAASKVSADSSTALATPGAAPTSARASTRQALFGPRPLIDGEDGTNYDVILERVSADVAPADFVEEIWVRNVVDLVWESGRLRRLKSQLLHVAAHEGLTKVLKPMLLGLGDADKVSGNWAAGDKEAVADVKAALDEAGLTIDAVMAQTLAARIDDVERIDRMIIIAEVRRDAVLREIRSRRAALGHSLHRAAEAIDAEFEDVAPALSPA